RAAGLQFLPAQPPAGVRDLGQRAGADRAERLAGLLEPLARAVADSGLLPPGNPVGLTGDSYPTGH
ncbi:hypothetical protein ACWEN3_39250, partial [Streptomyces sp. NPDC004561]